MSWFQRVTAKDGAPSTDTTTPTKTSKPSTTTKKTTTTPSTDSGSDTGTTKTTPSTSSGGCSGANWDCITHRDRLTVNNCNTTVTGTVIAASDGGPHYAPDGDLVFAFKQDSQYNNLINSKNTSNKKYSGGLWVEGVCQKANKAPEPRHQGDCKCSATKFAAPKVGDKLKITGAHITDVGEDGHNEIHPMLSMEKLTAKASLAEFVDNPDYHQYVNMELPRIQLSNLRR